MTPQKWSLDQPGCDNENVRTGEVGAHEWRRRSRFRGQWHRHPESRPFAGHALYRDTATHAFNDVVRNGETKSSAGKLPCLAGVDLLKFEKYAVQLIRANPDA